MGHGKLRHDNTCLNCGSVVRFRYCSNCGQENVEPKESFGAIVSHFFADITHFDGKFFNTCKYLIALPGFLPKEFMEGRRVRYLHPIRMYVFTSALFFLIFFSVFTIKEVGVDVNEPLSEIDSALSGVKVGGGIADSILTGPRMSSRLIVSDDEYSSVAQYDSVQNMLPAGQRDNWFTRRITRQGIALSDRYNADTSLLIKNLLNKFFHSFPTLLFISLPLFALYLKLLYRRHKQLFYADHAIFLIYLYIFTFLLVLVLIGINALQNALSWNWIGWLGFLVVLYGIYYGFSAMKRFYGGNKGKTLLKFLLLNLLAGATMLGLFIIFFVLSIFQI